MRKIILVIIIGLIFNSINAQNTETKNRTVINNKKELKVITDTIVNLITTNYVYEKKGEKIAEGYAEIVSKEFSEFPISYQDFAKKSSSNLKDISNDKHFFMQAPKEKSNAGTMTGDNSWYLGPDKGYGFTMYELLEGNIAYIKYSFFNFTMMPEAGKTIDRIIALCNLSNAVILDLRNNPGGDSDMADYFFSYFMPKDSLYLSSFMQREKNGELFYSESFSYKNLPENRINNKPVFILVNKKTGSSAEYFAFLAQNHTNATIIGEQTAGAGHSLTVLKVNPYLTIGVPSGRLYDKTSNKGWEETNGILPDVIIEDSLALKKAHSMALKKVKL